MALKIFYSYAHEDGTLRIQLEKHLAALRSSGFIIDWHERNITAGQEWEKEVDSNLNTADLILLLISPDFVSSSYHCGKEMARALERHENGSARVIPIILRHGDYEGMPFSKLLALPTDATPVRDRKWRTIDEAFRDVAQGIRKAVNELIIRQWLDEADIHFYRQQYDQAMAIYAKIICLDPLNAFAYTGQGRVLLQRSLDPAYTGEGEIYKVALGFFEKSISIDVFIAFAYIGKAETLAKSYYQVGSNKRPGIFSEITNAYIKAMQLEPTNELIYISQAKVFKYLGKNAEALEAYEKTISVSTPMDINLYKEMGDVLFSMGNYKRAVVNYEMFPDNGECCYKKGEALFHLRCYSEALIAYQKAISLGYVNYDLYLHQGSIFLHRKNYQKALAAYEEAIQLNEAVHQAYLGKKKVFKFLMEEASAKADKLFDALLDDDIDLPDDKGNLPDDYDPFLDEDLP